MSNSIRSELSAALRTKKPSFIVLPFRAVRTGDTFLPIEKRGRPFTYRDNRGRIQQERMYEKADELYVKANDHAARSTVRDADGIFLQGDWCVVKRS